ncbi:MAG: hypothetical protein SGJ21_14965 [Alphaproteobacteria bacterium]|nr:hypothetical protein [Alphaproteobacteria bacterium]
MTRAGMLLFGLFAASGLPPHAAAQLAKGAVATLSPEQVKEAIFGVDMQGHSPSFAMDWRECIEPGGATLYQTPAGVERGKAWVTVQGFACFSYEDTGFATASCYRVSRKGDALTFTGEGGVVFIATEVRRGVKTCKPAEDLIS